MLTPGAGTIAFDTALAADDLGPGFDPTHFPDTNGPFGFTVNNPLGVVPEPSSCLIFSLGLGTLGVVRVGRRRQRK